MLQLHLSYQQFNRLLRCDLHKRFYGISISHRHVPYSFLLGNQNYRLEIINSLYTMNWWILSMFQPSCPGDSMRHQELWLWLVSSLELPKLNLIRVDWCNSVFLSVSTAHHQHWPESALVQERYALQSTKRWVYNVYVEHCYAKWMLNSIFMFTIFELFNERSDIERHGIQGR